MLLLFCGGWCVIEMILVVWRWGVEIVGMFLIYFVCVFRCEGVEGIFADVFASGRFDLNVVCVIYYSGLK